MDAWGLGDLLVGGAIGSLLTGLLLERYRFKMARQQTRHDKQVEIIGEISKRLFWAESYFKVLVRDRPGDPPYIECREEARRAGEDLEHYFNENRVFFDEPLCERMDALFRAFHDAWDVTRYLTRSDLEDGWLREEYRDSWEGAWRRIHEDVPAIREELQRIFRKVVGIPTRRDRRSRRDSSPARP